MIAHLKYRPSGDVLIISRISSGSLMRHRDIQMIDLFNRLFFLNTWSLWTANLRASVHKMSAIQSLDDCFAVRFAHCGLVNMGQVTELWLSCYLVLLSIDSKTRKQDSCSSVTWPISSWTLVNCLRLCFVGCWMTRHNLEQCWCIVNRTLRIKPLLHLTQNASFCSQIYIWNVVCKMLAILQAPMF